MSQLPLFAQPTPEPPGWYTGDWPWHENPAGPSLDWWDAVVVCSSGGKDSQAMTLWLSIRPGFDPVRTWLVHNDTGQEHRGAKELALETGDLVGVPAGQVRVTKPHLGQTLLTHVLRRGMWPGLAPHTRPCHLHRAALRLRGAAQVTERLKVAPTDKLLRRLGDEARVLILTGERWEESANRAKMPEWAIRWGPTSRAQNPRKPRLVVHWRPVLAWRTGEVFEHIGQHGQKPLWVYEAGAVRSQIGLTIRQAQGGLDGGLPPDLAYSRASCAFCIYLRPAELELSFNLYPALALLAARIEVYIDHTWRQDLTLGQMWSKVYGPNGYRASEGARLLALSPEQLVHEATG